MLYSVLITLSLMTSTPPCTRDGTIVLPGPAFYPESVAGRLNGDVFAGSFLTGAVARSRCNESEANIFAVTEPPYGSLGLEVDELRGSLYQCQFDVSFSGVIPSRVVELDIRNGETKNIYELPMGLRCNDMAQDLRGNLYVTEMLSGGIWRLPLGGTALEPWFTAPELAAPPGVTTGPNGIAAFFSHVYVSHPTNSAVYRIDLNLVGQPQSITALNLDSPGGLRVDGMYLEDLSTLVAAVPEESRVVRIHLDNLNGHVETIATNGKGPTSATRIPTGIWYSPSQMLALFTGLPPTLPFTLQRISP